MYYNDDVYVGQVHDGRLLEFISFDPMQGAVFYVMNERQVERPRFERSEQDCVQCHVASTTKGIPGVFLRSVYAGPSGTQAGGTPAYITGHESPFSERWGGWFVTLGSYLASNLHASGAQTALAYSTQSWGAIIAPFIVAYKQPDPEKLSAYECGFNAFDDARMKFDVRFYLVAILFIIFDLEVSFLFPWAVAYGKLGATGFWSMLVFLAVLTVGFAYEWKKGALEWD